MRWTKILSLRHWSHIFRRTLPLLTSGNVPFTDKLLLVAPALLYWVLPDVLPFIPIDDMAVTLLLMNWFVTRTERKYPGV
ncbi:hypothetical protein EHV15_18815 [Paenibacillus oralis]|uniref:DUF1232 domain-containing protein n=1 Tax=Paenibacillus oralis TaxID=2490856 RepID=A0A3P3U336_9BACL|nr:hypothetical protein [Paenibacillus oralis]RRJ64745.1 hypothetical protein EHV15_18815 [Paenibacillus oralis]